MKAALFAALLLCLPAMAERIPRSAAEVAAFKRENPCPSTGLRRGKCPDFEVDHVTALCAYGRDHRDNMQWMTIQEHRWKTRTDVRVCRQLRKEAGKQ
jgi:hypothetical protein